MGKEISENEKKYYFKCWKKGISSKSLDKAIDIALAEIKDKPK